MMVFIVSIVFIVIIGTILWVRPTAKERKKAALRARAISMGFRISYNKADTLVLNYSMFCKTNLNQELKRDTNLHWRGGDPNLLEVANTLPLSISAVAIGQQRVVFSWDESGEGILKQMQEFVETVRQKSY